MASYYTQTKIKDIDKIKSAYFIGIKGVGMTALAQILSEKGVKVDGSDTDEKFFTDEVLKKIGITPNIGFSADNLPDNVDIVIASVAYMEGNVEVQKAQEDGLQVVTYPELLAKLFNDSYGIAVCGSHGKSTTTAMLGHILEYAQYDPTVVVGSRVNAWSSNARAGNSDYFVIEADEYRDAFLRYYPELIVLTNIDYDHPDYFKTEKDYQESFNSFKERVPKDLLIKEEESIKDFDLKIPGIHNQKNANLAYKAAVKLGVNSRVAEEALESFEGIARRFENKGVYNGAVLIDDYAHHPKEIDAAVQAAKEKWPNKKLVVLFQPHTFSRTKNLFKYFKEVLCKIDEVYILKTYGSAREKEKDDSGKKLAEETGAEYFETHNDAAGHISKRLSASTVFLALGAGDGWRVCDILKEKNQ